MSTSRFRGRESAALAGLREVTRALGPLADRVVFIGGAIAPLLQSHPVSAAIRPTKDVDGVAKTATYSDFDDLQAKLRARGFRSRGTMSDPTGHAHRWVSPGGVLFDLVPAGDHLSGSGNPWDQVAARRAVAIDLAIGDEPPLIAHHADAVSFIALKWSAYRDRGGGDLFGSHDVEDIFAVLASRRSLADECAEADAAELRPAIAAMARAFISNADDFGDLLAAHVVLADRQTAQAVYRNIRRMVLELAALI